MDNQTEEGVITFSQIWRVIKKSLARAAIYVIVAVIVSFAVLFAVRTVAATNSYSATITFKQSDETIKSTLDSYRATAVSKAVDEVFGTSDDTTEIYETVLETLAITSYIPAAYEDDTSYIATTFTVSFDELGLSGVNKAQQTSLLDNICSELISYYSEVNSTDLLSDDLAWGYSADYTLEYLDILDELETRLSTFEKTLSASISANIAVNSQFSTFKSSSTDSNRRTAYELLAQIDNIEYTVTQLRDTIIASGIYNSGATLNGVTYCENKINSYTKIELQAIKTVVDAYSTQIEEMSKMIKEGVTNASSGNSTGTTTVSVDLSSYTALVEQYLDALAEQAAVQQKIDELEVYKNNIGNNEGSTEPMETIEAVIQDVLDIVDEYNALVEDFEEEVMPSAYATISKPAAAYEDSIISFALLFIGVIAVAVIAYAVAFGQTWAAMKKAGTLDDNENLPLKTV